MGDVTDDEVRNLPPGTQIIDPYTGERLTLDRHTDTDDGWLLNDGSWLRWHHLAEWLNGKIATMCMKHGHVTRFSNPTRCHAGVLLSEECGPWQVSDG